MAGFTNADLTPSLTIAFKATQISIARNFERVFDFDNGCGINSRRTRQSHNGCGMAHNESHNLSDRKSVV